MKYQIIACIFLFFFLYITNSVFFQFKEGSSEDVPVTNSTVQDVFPLMTFQTINMGGGENIFVNSPYQKSDFFNVTFTVSEFSGETSNFEIVSYPTSEYNSNDLYVVGKVPITGTGEYSFTEQNPIPQRYNAFQFFQLAGSSFTVSSLIINGTQQITDPNPNPLVLPYSVEASTTPASTTAAWTTAYSTTPSAWTTPAATDDLTSPATTTTNSTTPSAWTTPAATDGLMSPATTTNNSGNTSSPTLLKESSITKSPTLNPAYRKHTRILIDFFKNILKNIRKKYPNSK